MAGLFHFARDSRGAISVIFAVSLVGLMAGAGMSIDAARLFKAREALQAAADSAALAVSADVITNSSEITELAREYLDTNAPPPDIVTIGAVSASYVAGSKTVTINATGTVPTIFMALLGLSSVDVSVQSSARRAQDGPLDLVLALDLTTSMREKINGEEKVSTLKEAARSLTDSVMSNANARVGIVPFANYVQVGRGFRGSAWLSADDDVAVPWCAWSGGGSFGTCQYLEYPCTIDGGNFMCKKPVNCVWEKDTSPPEYKCGVNNYSWGGCVLSRMSGNEYLTSIADPEDPKYVGRVTTSANERPPNADGGGCSGAPITEITTNKGTVYSAFNSFGFTYPVGETYIPDGLLWSWNMLTSEAPLTSARSRADMERLGGKKALVLMTDGFNTRYAGTDGWHYPTNSDASLRAKADDATSALCANVKADGILVYTVAFAVSDEAIKTLLRSCASSPEKFFDASDAQSLKSSFSRIGAELQRVRLTK